MKVGDLFDMFNNECEEDSGCNQSFMLILIILALIGTSGCCSYNCNCEKDNCCSCGCNGGNLGILILIIAILFSCNNGFGCNKGENEVINEEDC